MNSVTKILKNVLILFLVVNLLFSCAGNNSFVITESATLSEGMQYGIFQGLIVFPIGIMINSLTVMLGSAGLAMVVTTIVVRTITLPVTLKTTRSQKAMQAIQPKMAELEKKYHGRDDQATKQKKAMEMQKMYADLGINPLSSILFPFLTLPIFMGVWRATQASQVIVSGGGSFLGFSLGTTPGNAIAQGDFYYISLILIVGVVQYVQFKLSTHLSNKRNKSDKNYRANPKADAMTKQMGILAYIFPVMMMFMSLSLASAMSIYLIVSGLIMIAQTFYIDKVMRNEA